MTRGVGGVDARRIELLRRAVLALLVTLLAILAVFLIFPIELEHYEFSITILCVVSAVVAVTLLLLRRGHVTTGRILILVMVFVVSVAVYVMTGGTKGPGGALFASTLVFAGILYGWRGLGLMLGAEIGAGGVLLWLEGRGSLDVWVHEPKLVASFVVTASVLATIAAYLGSFLHRLGQSVADSQASEADARRSEAELQALMEQSPDGILVLDAKDRIRGLNPALGGMLGVSAAAVMETPLGEIISDAGSRQRLGECIRTIRSEGELLEELELRLSPERALVIEAHGKLMARAGSAGAVQIVMRDRTAQREAEAVLEDLEGQLRDARRLESIGRLAGGVAHDFNNLLTAVLGNTELLKDDEEFPERYRPDLEIIEQGALRAADLTRQLLAFARRQVLAPQVLVVNEVVAGLEPVLRRTIRENIDLKYSLSREAGSVRVDPSQLEQVLINLVANARDSMLGGGSIMVETLSLEIDSAYTEEHLGTRPGRYVALIVTDTGEGMDEETRERAFEPFFTTKAAGEGTGLGLATVHGIVKQSGGHILIYSEPGRGTSFKVLLPEVERASTVKAPQALAGGSGATGTILLVDDEAMVRESSARILRRAGHEVLIADSGEAALDILAGLEVGPDLLVTDLVMRGMSGAELAQKVGEVSSAIRILYISGYTENVIVHDGELDPGVELLLKPFTGRALVERVDEVLGAAPTVVDS